MASSAQMVKRRASNWYMWLWLSPLLTLPLLAFLGIRNPGLALICGGTWRGCNHALADRVTLLVAVLGSSLWHLILLYPALKDDSEFARWHGRQALLLAAVRTALPLVSVLAFGSEGVCLFPFVVIPVYFVGNVWGQRQATRGDCSLMRRFGREAGLLPSEPAMALEEAKEPDAEALVDIIRYSRNPEVRRQAVAELDRRGMVESLGDASAAKAIPTTAVAAPDVASASKKNLLIVLLGGAGAILWILVCGAVVLSATLIGTPTAPRPTPTPTPTPTYLSQAFLHSRRGQYEEAIADYTEAIRLNPKNAAAYFGRGNAYSELGEYEEAVADYREAVRLNPTYAAAYNNLAWTMAYHLDTDYEEALEYALRAVQLQPSAYNQDTLALVYYKLERYDEALEHYSLALSRAPGPGHAASYRGRGDVYLALGDHQAALGDYQKYLDLVPEASDRQAVEETIEWLQGQAE
jgi:tetratricopeptide (TPR) repeat protein